jgi:hypothetical protein
MNDWQGTITSRTRDVGWCGWGRRLGTGFILKVLFSVTSSCFVVGLHAVCDHLHEKDGNGRELFYDAKLGFVVR